MRVAPARYGPDNRAAARPTTAPAAAVTAALAGNTAHNGQFRCSISSAVV